MTANAPGGARSLLILTNDYGELGLAMSLLRGQEFSSRARMLVPEALFSSNKSTLHVPAKSYVNLDDILRTVHEHEPNLVFLLSGYLFSNERLLSPHSLGKLVDHCRDRGCRVVTSDPLLGLASKITVKDVDRQILLSGKPLIKRWLLAFMLQVGHRRIGQVPCLEKLTHLYPTSVPDQDPNDHVPRFSFFNPQLAAPSGARTEVAGGAAATRPRWLFVLSSIDLDCQRALSGFEAFARSVALLLVHAWRAGSRPTLIAPRAILEPLAKGLPDVIELLGHCPFIEFEKRVLDAEFVFYWNAFSFSMLPRVAHGLPVFLFDRGHLSRTVKPFYEVALKQHFGGWSPPYLDPTEPLDRDALSNMGEKEKVAMQVIRKRWQSSPTPDELIHQLLE